MEESERKRIISLVKREVVPAIGCTEPVSVALCVAKTKELLGAIPEKIEIFLSANMLKNAMGVGIPGTGMTGLPIAVALGALIGRSEYGLEVLKECTPEAVEKGKQLIDAGAIRISLKNGISDKLYIESVCIFKEHKAISVIKANHTNFVYLEKDGKVLSDMRNQSAKEDETGFCELNFKKVYEFSMETPLEEIAFILDSAKLNKAAAEQSLQGNYGHGLGRILQGKYETEIMGKNVFSKILSYTSAACDARMAGAMIPVMSNSGSGNQGITASLPVAVYAEYACKSEEELIRALMLSNLTVIYIKQTLGRLSALCGCVVASTGSSCGITYLMGGNYEQICYAVKNMIANLTGMICDGAKPSCSLKVSSGTSMAVLSALMAKEQKCVTSLEGIIDENVDDCIRNLTRIGLQGMNETDKLILDIMTHKC